jgi:DNA polymerase-1
VRLGTLDFETEKITPRPVYPPKPVGVSLKDGGNRSKYWAWGHPSGNNCTLSEARQRVGEFVRTHKVICHNAGFDLDVAETHLGVRWPAEHHDTWLMAFLQDPDSPSLALKSLAQRYFNEPPSEQDALKDYVVGRAKAGDAEFKGANKKNFGAYISRCGAQLVAPYACGDTDRTWQLFLELMPLVDAEPRFKKAYTRELALTRVLVKMERRGFPVATRRLAADIRKYEAVKRAVEEPLLKKMKVPVTLRRQVLDHYDNQEEFSWSGKGFAGRLVSSGLVEALPQTDAGNDSTSAESLAEVMPAKLVKEFEVRSQIATCLGTFMRPWLEQARETGHFYARFNQVRSGDEWGRKTGATTGRLSMAPNLQNVIRSDKDPRVPVLRDYLVTGEYGYLIQRDYSQQELRLLAHYEDGPFLRSYIEHPDQDGHLIVAELIRKTTGMVLKRRPVKDLNFGLIYGQGLDLTAQKMGLSREDADRARKAHAAALPGVPELQKKLKQLAANNLPLWTWGGRRYYCEPPKFINGRWRNFQYKMLNRLIQGSAADVTKQAMVNYDMHPLANRNPMLLQVHDELILGADGDPKKVHKALRECMADVDGIAVPMLSDGKLGRTSWHRMKKVSY